MSRRRAYSASVLLQAQEDELREKVRAAEAELEGLRRRLTALTEERERTSLLELHRALETGGLSIEEWLEAIRNMPRKKSGKE